MASVCEVCWTLVRNFENTMHMRQLSTIAQAIPDFHVLRIDRIANDLIKNGIDVIKLNLGKSRSSDA